jgi:hypothetical protein
MQTADQESTLLKNKFTRDLQTTERLTDDKIRNFKSLITETTQATEMKNEVMYEKN